MKTLSRLEFDLLGNMIQLDKDLNTICAKILLNIQVSGGKDSMVLLNALSRVINSKRLKTNNYFSCIVQHFDHKLRGIESDLDAHFVGQQCLKLGIPFFFNEVTYPGKKANFQNYARQYRKEKAILLSKQQCEETQFSKYFIVTAHHARDHVESVLQHILRGSGLNGLQGIQTLDSQECFFRPFAKISYKEIEKYCNEENIAYRHDRSNDEDKYSRNYIRHHILPHIEFLNPNFEKSFQKLSEQSVIPSAMSSHLVISKETSSSEIFYYFKQNHKEFLKILSSNAIHNILHESHIMLKKEAFFSKTINLKSGFKVLLKKEKNTSIELIPLL